MPAMGDNDLPPQDIVIDLPGCRNLSLNLVHGCQNNIIIHAADCRTDTNRADGAVDAGGLREVFWKSSEFPAWWRQLANESVGVFLDVQACDVSQGEAGLRQSLLILSRRYRSCLRACIETVAVGSADNADTHRQLLTRMEMVWNLCEILLIDQKRGGVVLYQLLGWVRQHATQFDRSVAEVTDAELPETHPEYWNTVYGMVMQGRQDTARKLLRLHSGFQTEPFACADELLRTIPVFVEGGAAGVADFEQRWRHWQEQCIRHLEDGQFGFSPRLQTLVKLLCGDAPTFEDLYQQLGSWYHLMISYTLYSRPWAGIFDLGYAAEDSIEVFGGAARCSQLDAMLQAVVEGDVHALLKAAQATLPDGWFTAHLADLLYKLHIGTVSDSVGGGPGRPAAFLAELRHHLLLEYGAALFASRPLWQLGAVYLDRCGKLGRARLALLLERLPPDSDRRARKIIQAAESRGLTDVASTVAQVMGRRALQAGQLGTALAWALRSESAVLASHLADTLVRQYTTSGRFSSADFIDNLGSCMLKSDRLMFLGKYREFHRLFEEDKLAEAASLLVTLMTSQLAPAYFWMTLLTDAVPLLEKDEVVISSAQTYQLMGCVEQLKRADKLDESADDVRLIRLALSRNLARAIITENSAVS